MEVRMSLENAYITEDGKFDIEKGLEAAGLKAAVCFKKGEITPWGVRESDSKETLFRRGLETILSDHVTPSQQVPISIEVYGIPKILCMYINNFEMQAADERSLRYTEVKENEYISKEEFELYDKWMIKLQDILHKDYGKFFLESNGNDKKRSDSAIKKIAQENARSFVTVFTPTSITYTSNLSEFNKMALQIEKTLNSKNNTLLEEKTLPYLEEFYNKLKKLNIVITNNSIWNINSEQAEAHKLPKNDKLLYTDPKFLNLNLFSNKNKFSSMHKPDEFGYSFHATREISLAGFAQLQRHRTLDTELEVMDEYKFFVPEFLKEYPDLVNEWIEDSKIVKDIYPQGQIIYVDMKGTLQRFVTYIGGERACNRAQYEISKFYIDFISEYYQGIKDEELKEILKPYVGVYRCRTKNYACGSPCFGGPRIDRKY